MDDAFRIFLQQLDNPSLFTWEHVLQRLDALDQIERQLFFADSVITPDLEPLIARINQANEEAYNAIRADIRTGRADRLLALAKESEYSGGHYDALDEVLSGVLQFKRPEANRVEPTEEMVFYQPTPAQQIFKLITLLELAEKDVFIDIGCGLGHVPILIAICTNARSIGVEVEPSYVNCGREAAANLNLDRVDFIESDALTASITNGTVFHLYTPFTGAMLQTMLLRLQAIADDHQIQISTLGPCTHTVAQEPWLIPLTPVQADQITIFQSLAHKG